MERLNDALLDELRDLMEDAFPSLLQTYLRDSELQFMAARDALASGDLESLGRCAHSLKGASSNIGAVQLAEYCCELERSARQARRERLPLALELVSDELREVRAAVEALYRAC
ncbi:MAG: Hpt domain-containing protein [Pseudomonadales bacterium]